MEFLRELFRPPDPQKLKKLEDVRGLINALHYMDVGVRTETANVLAEMRPAEAVPELIVALKDPDERVRTAVAHALQEIVTLHKDTPQRDQVQQWLLEALQAQTNDYLRQTVSELLPIFDMPAGTRPTEVEGSQGD
ncbi:MAG: HEAT repeat domain-containing protein [Chloroflexi bacterium]|nr:HEAT repeat domain-containing protein [Anaerolineaceae bacterium]NMB87764.1 HEAT repeat domain-containing protein [Chloroflexota bacterium]